MLSLQNYCKGSEDSYANQALCRLKKCIWHIDSYIFYLHSCIVITNTCSFKSLTEYVAFVNMYFFNVNIIKKLLQLWQSDKFYDIKRGECHPIKIIGSHSMKECWTENGVKRNQPAFLLILSVFFCLTWDVLIPV